MEIKREKRKGERSRKDFNIQSRDICEEKKEYNKERNNKHYREENKLNDYKNVILYKRI